MTSAVLAYIPSPPQGVWEVGPFPLRAYALFIIAGIIAAIYWGERRWIARGGKPGVVLDVAMFAVPFGLVGGRLYHVATDYQTYFGANGDPVAALRIWQGGLGIWGAVFFGGVGAWIACRIYRVPLPALADAIAPPILLAQAIGRLGNYFNQELYGRATTLPWGLEIYKRYDEAGQPDPLGGTSSGEVERIVHPTFLYELLWNLLIVVLLVLIDRRFRIGHGRLFALYVAGYCLGRFFVELMRDDYATKILGLRINTITSAVVFAGAIAYFLFATRGRERPQDLQPQDHPWPWQISALQAAGHAKAVAEEDNSPSIAVPDKVDSPVSLIKAPDSAASAVSADADAHAGQPPAGIKSADHGGQAGAATDNEQPASSESAQDSEQPGPAAGPAVEHNQTKESGK